MYAVWVQACIICILLLPPLLIQYSAHLWEKNAAPSLCDSGDENGMCSDVDDLILSQENWGSFK